MMPKNIILCADGTGNKGGYTPDSNVYKVYKAVEKNLSEEDRNRFGVTEQIIFYDNGVGTNKNKYLRALSGGLGFGFGQNVKDLYKFLARNYEHGDRVYLFGFSRGASTIRAFNGFVYACGLLKGKNISNKDLDDKVEEAFDAYRWEGIRNKRWHRLIKFLTGQHLPKSPADLKEADGSHGAIDIHFTGIWDTVVALGFPKRTDVVSPVSLVLRLGFMIFEKVANFISPHSFYNYRLTRNQIHAYQALALDDERTAFWPFVWNENIPEDGGSSGKGERTVEQVWFAGMHSNVGGGYNRSGLASVPLYWMMGKAQVHGLCFEGDAVQQARNDAHVHGRMYNSRDGAAILYRYHPREIESLCRVKSDRSRFRKVLDVLLGERKTGRLRFRDGRIRIYDSVINRMEHRTANYAPCLIPDHFKIVQDEIHEDLSVRTRAVDVKPASDSEWEQNKSRIRRYIFIRKLLYDIMVLMICYTLWRAFGYWVSPPEYLERSGLAGHLADVLDYILPDFFGGLIEVAVAQNPFIFLAAVAIVWMYILIRRKVHRKMSALCQLKRRKVIHADREKLDDTVEPFEFSPVLTRDAAMSEADV
ncbi:MAG: DUF2235 domain-containing protein [Mariprofundus sp.]